MTRQQTFEARWAEIERNIEARNRLIDRLRVDQRVKKLLQTLGELSFDYPMPEGSVVVPGDGSVSVCLPWSVLMAHARVNSKNTIKSWVDLALATPFVTVVPSTHTACLITVHWPELLRGDDAPSGPCGGGQSSRRRGSIPPPEGVNRGSTGGQLTGVNSPLNPETPGVLISGIKTKNPGIKPGPADERAPPPKRPDFWVRWRTAIAARRLDNPDHVQELYEIGVKEGLYQASVESRRQVFTQAAKDLRLARTPTAIFRENVAAAAWYRAANLDEDNGRKLMARVSDSAGSSPRTRVAANADLKFRYESEQPEESLESKKRRSSAELLAWQQKQEAQAARTHGG